MTCTNLPPRTGQQFSISHGDYHAVVTELGATLRKLTYQGEDIIVSPGPDDMVTCCHGQLLIPFPNRIENGAIGLVLFAGMTVYDAQATRALFAQYAGQGEDMVKKVSIICALNLYLDFINMFLYILQLFGDRD